MQSYQTEQLSCIEKTKRAILFFIRGFKPSEGEAGLQTMRDAENTFVAKYAGSLYLCTVWNRQAGPPPSHLVVLSLNSKDTL